MSAAGVTAGQPGSIDAGFVNSLTGVEWISDLTFQSDGKIVFAGSYIGWDVPQACVARVHPDGNFDSTFKVAYGHAGSRANCVLVQADGKILVGGYFTNFNEVPCRSIIRLNTDGSVDATLAQPDWLNRAVSQLIPQVDGKLLVASHATNANGIAITELVRLNSDATLDPAFAAPTFRFVPQVALQADGKILVGGFFVEVGGEQRNYLARLNPDGSLDEAFDARLSQNDRVHGLALQPDGRILLGGRFSGRLVIRLNADGTPDPTFISPVDVEDTGGIFFYGVNSFALEPGGKMIVSGGFRTINGFSTGHVARLNPDGTLDGNFDPGTGPDQIPARIILDPMGNLFVVGQFAGYNGVPATAWIRLLGGEPAPVAPLLKEQPVVLVLDVGRTVKLASLISAFPLPSYQWERDGVELPGATHSELVLTNLSPVMARTYRLRASNSLGSVISEPVDLPAPSIPEQPLPQTVRQGEDAAFSVSATHLLPLSFQWQLEGVDVPGATNAALELTSVQPSQAGAYTVIVSNALGIATSQPAILTVLPPTAPEILSQPQSHTLEAGMEVRFSVVATNYLPLTYQWQFNAADIMGATQANLTLPSVRLSDAGEYRVRVRSEYLTTQSDPALLVVKPVEFVPGPGVVTNATQADLEAAMSTGLPVRFGVNGVISLTNTLVITNDTTLDATGRSITLDGKGLIRHFEVKPQATLRLINLRLVDGRHAGARGSWDQHGQPGLGGSIYNAGGAVELIGCELINNQALGGKGGQSTKSNPTNGGPAHGGAVYSVDGRVWATGCVFGQNRCVGGDGTLGLGMINPLGGAGGDAQGGAIYVQGGALVLSQVTLTNNVAEGGNEYQTRVNRSGGSGIGGAVSVRETEAVLNACVFVANEALGKTRVSTEPIAASGSGGAIFKQQGTMTITGTRFTDNRALGGGGDSPGIETVINGAGNGGAIFNESGVLEIRECALTSNIAKGADQRGPLPWLSFAGDGFGGALYNAGELVVLNTTLAENRTIGGEGSSQNIAGSAFGGAIYSLEGSASLRNVTVANNSVQAGQEGQSTTNYPPQALGGSIMVTNGTLSLVNTILSCAPAQSNVWSTTTIVDGGHNLSSGASAEFSSTTSQGNIDPRLGPLADNGGLTPTMALLPGSPAIDAGDDSAAPPADQRSLGRPAGAHSDVGAFEVAAPGPLAITTPPADATVDTGEGVFFSVAVSAVPVRYQWQFNGADLTGATNALLRLDNVQVSQTGQYRVLVSDASGSVTSPAATLTVVPPAAPVILVQPQSQAVRISDPVSLSVVATNTLWLTYQWQHDGTDIPGATDSTLEISAVTAADAGSYTVMVSSPFLSTFSAPAVVTIDLRPFILTHPADQQVIEGRTASLSVEADGDGPLVYQWFLDGVALPGATHATLTLAGIPLTLAGTYTVTVRNSSGEITSQPASVSVRPSPLDLDFVPSPDLGIWNVSALSVRAEGKVYVAGKGSRFRVMSLNSNGSLDTTFTWPVFQPDSVSEIAFYPDESLLAGGGFELVSGVPRRYFARINSNGTLNGEFVVGYPFDFMIHTMTVQPDGKALIASGLPPVFLRLNPDGSVDATFTPEIESQVYRSFVVQADGRIVVQIANQNNSGALLVRCDAAGIRDGDFLVDFGAPSKLFGLVALPDGKLLAGGTFTHINGAAVSTNLVRLNQDGSVDQTFNPSVPIPPVLALAVERGGSILVGLGAPEGVIRLSADGVLDQSLQVNTGPVTAIAVLNDDTALIGGSFQEVDGIPRLGLAKLRLPNSAPQLEGVIRIGPMVRMSMITPLGKNSILEHAESLIAAKWSRIQTVPGDGTRHVFVDMDAQAKEGFYRICIE